MANWTTPQTWADGQVVDAADLNVDIRDNMTYTKEMAENASIGVVFSGSGTSLAVGDQYIVFAPGDATILGAQMRASDVNSDNNITVNVRRLRDSDGDTAFSSDHEIIAGKLTLDTDTGIYNRFTADTDWTTAIYENDQLQFRVESVTGVTLCSVQLLVHKG